MLEGFAGSAFATMRSALLTIVAAVLIGGQAGLKSEDPPPLKLQAGDIIRIYSTVKIGEDAGSAITVTPPTNDGSGVAQTAPKPVGQPFDPYTGEFLVQTDGAIYGIGFGRLVVAGRTISETQKLVRVGMRRLVKETEVFVTLSQQRDQHVFLVGGGSGSGTVRLYAGLTLRQALSHSPLEQNPDLIEAQVFRSGQEILKVNVREALKGGDDLPLQADDVVTLTPTSHLRVWVTGAVRQPGRVLLPDDSSPQEAVAAAGGIMPPLNPVEAQSSQTRDYKIIVHRGTEEIVLTADSARGPYRRTLQEGDSVEVVAPKLERIQVFGEVNRPGEVMTHERSSASAVIGSAGGITRDGSLTDVLLYRNGQAQTLNLSPQGGEGANPDFELTDGDVLVVRDTSRVFYVFGSVTKQGRVVIPEGKSYHLNDAIALSGGLAQGGTLRRMFVGHPDASGKMVVKQYNLDAYLKDGDLKSNPLIYPGDAILVGNRAPTTLEAASQILSSAVLAITLSRL